MISKQLLPLTTSHRLDRSDMQPLVASVVLLFFAFVPGYYLSRVLFPQLDRLSRVTLSIAMSVGLHVLLGSLLAFAGAFSTGAVWGMAIAVSLAGFGMNLLVHRKLI